MYGVSTQVLVTEIRQDEKIVMEWGNPRTTIKYEFNAIAPDSTYAVIKNYGFLQTGAELLRELMNNTGGFTTVLDGRRLIWNTISN